MQESFNILSVEWVSLSSKIIPRHFPVNVKFIGLVFQTMSVQLFVPYNNDLPQHNKLVFPFTMVDTLQINVVKYNLDVVPKSSVHFPDYQFRFSLESC